MQRFNEIVMEFNSYLHHHRFLEALDKFYAANVIYADNDKPPVAGIDNLRHEINHFIDHAQIHAIELVSLLIENNLSVTNWYYSLDHQETGRIDRHQLSVQRWKDNKIIQEHHFYLP